MRPLNARVANTCNFFNRWRNRSEGNNYSRQRVKMHQLRRPMNAAQRLNLRERLLISGDQTHPDIRLAANRAPFGWRETSRFDQAFPQSGSVDATKSIGGSPTVDSWRGGNVADALGSLFCLGCHAEWRGEESEAILAAQSKHLLRLRALGPPKPSAGTQNFV